MEGEFWCFLPSVVPGDSVTPVELFKGRQAEQEPQCPFPGHPQPRGMAPAVCSAQGCQAATASLRALGTPRVPEIQGSDLRGCWDITLDKRKEIKTIKNELTSFL